MSEERLQKVMAAAGVGSRRACEQLIEAGRVAVDGNVITELGTKVDAELVEIAVDGKVIQDAGRSIYIKMNKPRGILSDIGGDSRGRQTVADLLSPAIGRVFTVGRLDLKSEGLVLLTNDGQLAHHLTHPRFEHPKTYFVLVDEMPQPNELQALRQGIELSDGRTAPAQINRVSGPPPNLRLDRGPERGVWLRFVLREGKKRQIRHMVAAVGLTTQRLIRWAIGPLTLDDLPVGQWRYLAKEDINALRNAASNHANRQQSQRTNRTESHPRSRGTRLQGRTTPGAKRRRSQT